MGKDWLYCISDGFNEQLTLKDPISGDVVKTLGQFKPPGLYAFNFEQMIEHKQPQKVLLQQILAGECSVMHIPMEGKRFAYLENYERVNLIPIVHTN